MNDIHENEIIMYYGPWKVNLTYFKESGKFYSEGSYISHKLYLWDIWDELKQMFADGIRPGLIAGANEFYTLIEVPEHPHNHPYLWIPK